MLKWAGACALRASQHGDATTGEICLLFIPPKLPTRLLCSSGRVRNAITCPASDAHLHRQPGLEIARYPDDKGNCFFVPILDMLISGDVGSEEENMQTFVRAASVRGLTAVAGAHCRVCGQLHKGGAG